MSILVPERASVLSGLDSAAIADGRAPSAHLLRELARNGNRVVSRSELAARLSFDTGGIAGESMGSDDLHGWGTVDRWVPLTTRIPIDRNPFLRSYRAILNSYLEEDAKLYLQIETADWPYDPAASPAAPNVLTLDGDSGSDTWVKDALSLAVTGRASDYVRLWLRSDVLGTLDTGTYGSPASGTFTGITDWTAGPGRWTLEDSGATWNSGGSTPANGGHLVRIFDAFGNVVVPYTRILVNTGTTLTVRLDSYAGIPFGDGRGSEWLAYSNLGGCDYEIVETPTWRIGDFALYAEARTT